MKKNNFSIGITVHCKNVMSGIMHTALREKSLYYEKAYQFVTNIELVGEISSDRMRGIYTCH